MLTAAQLSDNRYKAEHVPKRKELEVVPNRVRRRPVAALIATAVVFGALYLAPSASAACGSIIFDYIPGIHDIDCDYGSGSEETWTVPAKITKPRFVIRGADAISGRGGFVEVKLPVKTGETLDLKMGGSGEASSVSHGGEPLLVAGGGNGKKPNYISPEAELLKVEEPGQPPGKYLGNGQVYIEWYDAREPFELTEPLPYIIADFFDSENVGFSHTGSWQEWTVPGDVKYATFELFGGEGESGEPRGHILAGLEVEPGETFGFDVGGYGEDTSLFRIGSFEVGVASGGDTERPNYLPWAALPAEEFWEGGGPESKPSNGSAIVHYLLPESSTEPPEEEPLTEEELPNTGHEAKEQRSGVGEQPSGFDLQRSQDPVPSCIVPRLRGRTLHSARRALAHANCTLGKVKRRHSRRRRVVAQNPPPRTVVALGRRVTVAVGTGGHHRRAHSRRTAR